jgi:hypothetical protein
MPNPLPDNRLSALLIKNYKFVPATYYTVMKKVTITLLAISVLAVSACSRKTCPTYAKVPTEKQVKG